VDLRDEEPPTAMSIIERLREEKPAWAMYLATDGTERMLDDALFDQLASPIEVNYRGEDIILRNEGWEFDWEEKIVGELPNGLLEAELLTDLTGIQDGDPKPGDRQLVRIKFSPEISAELEAQYT
jgi:hypothetical protein